MISTFEIWLMIGLLILSIDVFIILRLFLGRINSEKVLKKEEKQRSILVNAISDNKGNPISNVNIANYVQISRSIQFDSKTREVIKNTINIKQLEKIYVRNLQSKSKTKKVEAAVYLGALGTKDARLALEHALQHETNGAIKLYIANGLVEIKDKESLPVLIASLYNTGRFYRDKVNMLIAEFEQDFHDYLPNIIDSSKIEIKELIVEFSSVYFSKTLKEYLIHLIDTGDVNMNELEARYGNEQKKACVNCLYSTQINNSNQLSCPYHGVVNPSYYCKHHGVLPISINSVSSYQRLILKACNILADYYPKVLDQDKYLYSHQIEIKNIAVRALANFQSPDKIDKLLSFLRQEDTMRGATNAISYLIESNSVYFKQVIQSFIQEENKQVKTKLAKVLSLRIEYFIMKLSKNNSSDAKKIIKEILLLGRTSEIIDFLNKNKDINLENELIAIVKSVISKSEDRKTEFSKYLNERILEKCGLSKYDEIVIKKEDTVNKRTSLQLFLLLMGCILFVPSIYVMSYGNVVFHTPLARQLEQFIRDFNYYIAFYAILINLLYLVLLALSYMNVRRQERLWKIKDMTFLFKKKILPSISIIAPAFNEEATIIESANSLLNLKYPDYELIIVNDGSKDATLNKLIRYFDLKRVDYIYKNKLETKQIRGIYLNRSRPKLIVVDKINGGKADSLNVGINIANKEYICGIDADSLLEDDALIKLASLTLDEETETPALGGNILPINGCVVEHGKIVEKKLPKNKLAGFQTIEYIRAFMSGRLGWSLINSLLIISGAFGLFRKERVINVGGYLTSSGRFKTDTVGEDMELVVRISRQMHESKHKFRILYAYHANCWTEVPEDMKSLKRQRYRWHRGLIEILVFHKKMLFRPSYGRLGFLAMPYFYIFEMLGPIFEVQGYIMVVLSILLGLINYEIAMILFVSTVLMGVLVSVSSLLISEKNGRYFTKKELITLIFYAAIENFGVRQYFSMWRFGGYLKMFLKPTGWNKAKRKGFESV